MHKRLKSKKGRLEDVRPEGKTLYKIVSLLKGLVVSCLLLSLALSPLIITGATQAMAYNSSAEDIPPGLKKKLPPTTTTTTNSPSTTTTTTIAVSNPKDPEPGEPGPVKKAPTTTTTVKPADKKSSPAPAGFASTEPSSADQIQPSSKEDLDAEEIDPWREDEVLKPYMPGIEATTTGSWVDTESIAKLAASLERIDITRNTPPSQGQHRSSGMIGWIPAIMLVLTAGAGIYAKMMQLNGQK